MANPRRRNEGAGKGGLSAEREEPAPRLPLALGNEAPPESDATGLAGANRGHMEGPITAEERQRLPWRRRVGAGVLSLPLGLAVLVALLAITALGAMTAGLYILMASPSPSVWGAVSAVVAGPAILYLAFHIIRGSHWAWRALVAAIVLLVGSSIVRLVATPGLPLASIGELVVESLALYYLTRPEARAHFARPRSEKS